MPSSQWRTPSRMATCLLDITCTAPLDFHIKIRNTDTRLRVLSSQQRRRIFLKKHTHSDSRNLARKHLKSRRETLHVLLKSPPGIKAHAIPPRPRAEREFHHERGRGTLRAIYVHVLRSCDAVRFEQKH